jgi:translation initiation factor IF-1
MPRAILMPLCLLALASCAELPPQVYGAIYHITPSAREEVLAVARHYLGARVPGYHIFRLWIEWNDEVHVYYRSYAGPARHIIVRRIKGDWRVTDEQVKKAYPEEELQDMIVTP